MLITTARSTAEEPIDESTFGYQLGFRPYFFNPRFINYWDERYASRFGIKGPSRASYAPFKKPGPCSAKCQWDGCSQLAIGAIDNGGDPKNVCEDHQCQSLEVYFYVLQRDVYCIPEDQIVDCHVAVNLMHNAEGQIFKDIYERFFTEYFYPIID